MGVWACVGVCVHVVLCAGCSLRLAAHHGFPMQVCSHGSALALCRRAGRSAGFPLVCLLQSPALWDGNCQPQCLETLLCLPLINRERRAYLCQLALIWLAAVTGADLCVGCPGSHWEPMASPPLMSLPQGSPKAGGLRPSCSAPAALPGTRSSGEGIFIDYIVSMLLKFGCPFPTICPWQLPSAEASPPDSQHRSCQSRPHPSQHLTGPGTTCS